jgi:hypothetical protein
LIRELDQTFNVDAALTRTIKHRLINLDDLVTRIRTSRALDSITTGIDWAICDEPQIADRFALLVRLRSKHRQGDGIVPLPFFALCLPMNLLPRSGSALEIA